MKIKSFTSSVMEKFSTRQYTYRLFLECVIMEQVDTYFSRHFSSEMSTNSIPYNVYLENYEVVDDELAPNIGPDLLGIPNFFEANLAFPSK